MTDPEPERLLVFDNTCLSAFASAHLMPVLRDLTLGYRVGTTEAVRDEFCAGPNNVADIAWIDLLPEQGMDELVALAEYVQALGAGEHDLGEATVFASAQVRGAIAITDDATATKVARRIKKVEVHGSLWLLISAYRNGKVNDQRAVEIVDALRARGARYPCAGAELFSWARSHNLLE